MLEGESVTIICDPLLSEYGPLRPAILIAKELKEKDNCITIVSSTISPGLERELKCIGIQTVNLEKEPLLRKSESMAWLEEWCREATFSMNSRNLGDFNGLTLNFSNTVCLAADAWYAQGPPTVTLDNMRNYLPLHYKLGYSLLRPFLKILDKSFTRRIADRSNKVVSNSEYLALVYDKFGIHVNCVIYPPLDCEKFKPTTNKPRQNFVLTYFGKETIFDAIESIMDAGIKVVAFGGKLSLAHRRILKHPNLDFLGRIDDQRLVELYSNALFTLYPFTDEPFGYIPIESLACGTPVMTFEKQGPRETITHMQTGWLVNDNTELLDLAHRIWRRGYPNIMRRECRRQALRYDIHRIIEDWEDLMQHSR